MGKNKDIVERFWQVMESHDLAGLGELLAADGEFRGPGAPALRGPEQVRPFLAGWLSAFPDLRHEVLAVAEAGDTIALELRITGTHTGALRGPGGEIPPTGHKVVWESCDFIRIAGGKVVSWHAYWDQVAFLTQLGLMGKA